MAGPLHPGRFAAAAALAALLLGLPPGPGVRAQETPYSVSLHGIEDKDLFNVVEATTSLFRLRNEPPPSPVGLERRADADRERIIEALRSFGYYEGAVDIRIDTTQSPAKIDVVVEPGPLYRYDDVAAVGPEDQPVPELVLDRRALGLERGEPARARNVIEAEGRLTGELAAEGYAKAQVTDRRVVVDRADKTMDIAYTVERGPLVRFGETRITGLSTVEERIVRNRLPWKQGQVYDPSLIEDARASIAGLGPFGSVRVALADEPGPDGTTPVEVALTERPPRVIGFGFEYSSIDGLGGNARWGHRNLFGAAESLSATLSVSGIGLVTSTEDIEEQDFATEIAFRKPDYLLVNQALTLSFQVLRENAEAYIRDAAVLTAGFEYQYNPRLLFRYGIQAEEYRDRGNEFRTVGTLVGLPLGVTWNRADSLLNPTRGFRADLEVTPFKQLTDEGSDFVSTRWTVSGYHDIAADGRYVLAGRTSLGMIAGSSLAGVPPHRRFYAGGGGSVRGYGYQKVGPRDPFGDPRGGLSLFEASVELRYKLTESFGIVPFVDAGNVYSTTLPKPGSDLKYGAGLGVRYYTGIGPLRADLAFPLNKDPGDPSWAFYISIGQSF